MKSNTDTLDPRRDIPQILAALPNLLKARNDIVLPMWEASKILMDDPKRVSPTTEIVDPKRAKARTDMVLPKCKKSKTEAEEPIRVTPTADTDELN